MKKKVLVLLATYNGEKYIAEQIRTIFLQKNCNISVLISDDCSTDNTHNTILDLKKKYKKISIKRPLKKFDHSGQNFYYLIRNCNADNFDYVAFADQDDLFYFEKFNYQISQMVKSGCLASSSSVRCFGYSNKILSQSPNVTNYDFLFEGAGQGCSFLIEKNLFLNYQYFVKNNYHIVSSFVFHDWLTYLYLRSTKRNWKFIKKPLLKYRIHRTNSFGDKYSLRGIYIRVIKLFNGWYYNQVLLANKISRIVDNELPDFNEITTYQFVTLLVLNGRRRISDRIITFFSLLPLKILKKIF
jgi:rhamnosyltransferase